jgi:hypothetical protein
MSMDQTGMEPETSGWAAGWITFAGIAMIMIGVFHAIAGLSEIFDSDSFVLTQEYVLKLNASSWGWIHLIAGIVILFAGFGVFRGAVWARTVGVIIAMLSAIANFAWLVYVPLWSILMIFLDVSIIWALTVHGRDLERISEPQGGM